MSGTGIRHSCYDIRFYIITLRQLGTALITHLLYTDAFIG